MTVEIRSLKENIHYECWKCKTEMLLPEWVSQDESLDDVVFQCPKCGDEADIDVTEYPRHRIVIKPLCLSE